MKTLLLAGTAVLALATAPAMAADLAAKPYPVKAPVAVVPAFSWTGFYLGANIGYAWSDVDASTFVDPFSYRTGFSPDGFIGGGQVGFNYQFENNVVLGAEADIEFGDVNDSAYLVAPLGADFDVSSRVKTDYFGTVRARLGYAFDTFLPYVTGGFAWAHTKASTSVIFDDATFSDSDENTHVGWVIGGGLEYAFAPNWTAKVEYLYSDLGSETYTGNFDGPYSSDVDLKIQTVKLGVNYKF